MDWKYDCVFRDHHGGGAGGGGDSAGDFWRKMMKEQIHLVRDMLDHQMIDKNDDPMGRIDGMVIAVEEGERPRVVELQGGIVVLGNRLGERIGRWIRLAAMKWG